MSCELNHDRPLLGLLVSISVDRELALSTQTRHPMLPFWGYYINQLCLKDGSLVPADELPQKPCHSPSPEVGDEVAVSCRGKQLKAKVTGIQTADPNSNDKKDRIQVEEM
jgi:hypothetical protein